MLKDDWYKRYNQLIRNNSFDEDLIPAVIKTSATNKVDKSGSGIVDKLLSAVNALTKRVNYLKFELREKKMIKRLTHIVEGNFYVKIVLTIIKISYLLLYMGHSIQEWSK